jgi:flagellar motor switch protein FliM
MEKILSQNEIDALLRGVEEGKVETALDRKDEVNATRYDFANPDRVLRGRIPAFEILNDQFPRLFKNTLSSVLRKMVDVNSKGVRTMRFDEFMKPLPVPSSMHIFRMEPLRGHCLLVLESKVIFTLLDIFFGGSGKTLYKVESRDFTAIELKFVNKLVTHILSDFEKTWQAIYPLKIQYVRSEVNPEFVSIAPQSDPIITIPFEIEFEQFTGVITLCVPYSLIKPIKAALYARFQGETQEIDRKWIDRFLDRIKGAEVEVSVELGRRHMAIRDLLNLKAGDTLLLDKDASDPLITRVQGVPKFSGRAGLFGTNKAIQIEGKIKTS